MSYAATRSSGANHRSHSNSNSSNNNNNSSNSNNCNDSSNTNQYHLHHHQSHHNHHHQHPQHLHHHHPNQHPLTLAHPHQQHHLQPLVANAAGSSSSSVSSTSSSSAPAPAPQQQQQQQQQQQVPIDPQAANDNIITTITAGHASATPATCSTGAASSVGPPHYVDLHVNAGECVSLQLFDGQDQLVAGPATITLVSQQQNPPVPIPVQVPPGHMIHQIADENGTLKHIILSVMEPSAPPTDPVGALDSTVITSLPQAAFWNGGNQPGVIYQPPNNSTGSSTTTTTTTTTTTNSNNNNNNIVATSGGDQNNYQQQQQPPSGAANHIYINGKQQGYPITTTNSTALNHGPAHIRSGAGSGSISPMRSRVKGQHHNHHNQHHHNHHHHHHNNNNNSNHSHNHNHNHHHQQQQQQQQHHVHRSASSSSSHNNSHNHSNHSHYHQSPINSIDHNPYHHNPASFAAAASPPAPISQQNQTPAAVAAVAVAKQTPIIPTNQTTAIHQPNQQLETAAAAAPINDKSGPAWQPGNKFVNHNQQQVQSNKSLSPASSAGRSVKLKPQHQAASSLPPPVSRLATTNLSPSPETSNSSSSDKANNDSTGTVTKHHQLDISAVTVSPSHKLAAASRSSKERQQPTVDSTPKQVELETIRVSRGKQKKHQAAATSEHSSSNAIDPPEPQSCAAGERIDEIAEPEARVKVAATRVSIRTSLSENNIQALGETVSGESSEPADVVKHLPSKSAAAIGSSGSDHDDNSTSSSALDNDTATNATNQVPAPSASPKKKSTSVESSKRHRSSKGANGAEPKALKLNALPQLKILNLSCTSVSSSSVQLRWSYVPTLAEKYGIQQHHHHHHHHHSKHTHILDHFVIETSADKNADTNQLIAPKVVYQGCAMTCRIAHLQADRIYHFRVRRTALVNATATTEQQQSGCAPSKQEHLVVSEILSVTLTSNQPVQQQQQQQQTKKKAAAMVISSASTGDANRGNASSHQLSNSNHHNHHNGGATNINKSSSSSSSGTIKLSNLSKQCRTRIVSMFGRMVKNSLSSCSDTKFAGLLLVLFTIFAMLLAIFIHLYFVAPVIE